MNQNLGHYKTLLKGKILGIWLQSFSNVSTSFIENSTLDENMRNITRIEMGFK